jgi:hypothetical protein
MPNRACHFYLTLFVLWLAGTTIGCGDSGGRLAISGKVTFDGQPVADGNIGLVPRNTSTATAGSAETNSAKTVGADIVAGQYAIPRDEGPVAGSYTVVIYAERPTGRKLQADEGSSETVDQLIQYIPTIYNDRSTLTAELDADRDDLDFTLEKPKQTGKGRR